MSLYRAVAGWLWSLVGGQLPSTTEVLLFLLAIGLLLRVFYKPSPGMSGIQPRQNAFGRVRVEQDLKVPILTEYNFKLWYRTLSMALNQNEAMTAILEPLPSGDPRDTLAMAKIHDSVSESTKYSVLTVTSAFEALQLLKSKYDCNYEDKRQVIVNKIGSLKLLDYNKVDEHTEKLKILVQQYSMMQGEVTPKKQVKWLADSLTGQMSEQCKDAILTYRNVEDAIHHLKSRARDFAKKDVAFTVNKSFSGRTCFKSGKRGHIKKFCPVGPNVSSDLPSAPVIENKVNLSYSCSAAAQEWVLDSGAKPHYTNSNHNLTSVSRAGNSSVTLADGSTCKVYGTGQVFLHTGWEPLKLTIV